MANGQGVTILSAMVYRPWPLEDKRIGTAAKTHDIPSMDGGLAYRRGTQMAGPLAPLHEDPRDSCVEPQSYVQSQRP